MDRDRFDRIRTKHGGYASWAVWAEPTGGPKSNIGDVSVLDPDLNPTLLDDLRDNVVMLGLTISRDVVFASPFENFHDARSEGQDYKIRYAFFGSPFYGAYMTDLIKGTVMLQAGNLRKLVNTDPALVAASLDVLREELADLGSSRPTLIAFGGDTYGLASKHIPPNWYGRLVKVTHYSHYISKENYRQRVYSELAG